MAVGTGVPALAAALRCTGTTLQFPSLQRSSSGPSTPTPVCPAVNAYVVPTLKPGQWSLPRQSGGLPQGRRRADVPSPLSGVSSFAFQGTNAHVLLGAPAAGASTARAAMQLWQRGRYWVHAVQFDLISLALSDRRQAFFITRLQAPAAAELLQVSSGGSLAVTAGTVVELAAAASMQLASGLASSVGSQDDGSMRMIRSLAVSNALLPPGPQAAASVLQVAVTPAVGSFEVLLHAGGSKRGTGSSGVCASGRLERASNTAAPPAVASTSSTAAAALLLPIQHGESVDAMAFAVLAAQPHSLLQTTAVGPAAVEAALQLHADARLMTAAEAVLFGSLAATAAPKQALAGATSARVGSCGGPAGPRLSGISTNAAPRTSARAAHAVAAAAEADQAPHLLYSIAWEAISAAPQASHVAGPSVAARRGAGAADAIAVAQVALTVRPGSLVAALQGGVQPTAVPAATAATAGLGAAALHGVLKVLAQEAPGTSVAVRSNSAASSHGSSAWQLAIGRQGLPNGSADLHGVCSAGGAAFLPRLLAQPADGTPPAGSSLLEQGSFAVTGGSGSLGGYIALWLLQRRAQSVLLLSRTGGVPAAVLAASETLDGSAVTSCKADAALAADVAHVLTAAGAPMHGIMHAGGMLADATLPNQTLAGIRQVKCVGDVTVLPECSLPACPWPACSLPAPHLHSFLWFSRLQVATPKQAALARLQPHAAAQPLAHLLLFSSVAALLGSPGQANYSVANAALDETAQHAQAQAGVVGCSSVSWMSWPAVLVGQLCWWSTPTDTLVALFPAAGCARRQRAVGCLGGRRHGGTERRHRCPPGARRSGPHPHPCWP